MSKGMVKLKKKDHFFQQKEEMKGHRVNVLVLKTVSQAQFEVPWNHRWRSSARYSAVSYKFFVNIFYQVEKVPLSS